MIEEIGAMAGRLSEHTGHLETMVQERTQALAQVNERLLTLVDALERAGDGIEITDPQARFIYVNPAWEKLTGYSKAELHKQITKEHDFQTFFAEAPAIHPNSALITGVVCGVRVEDIEDPLVQKVRYLDKLIDELAKGKPLDKIMR